MTLKIGPHSLPNPVALAPMSGISDLPFRRCVERLGAGLVVSEMVASDELVRERPDVVLRTAMDDEDGLNVIQLAGREANWMKLGAEIAEQRGADIIDINMGCPARQVTGQLSGSALMRDLDHALTLVEAVIEGTTKPVTLKMRLGWDHDCLNAPELAQRAEAAGVQLVTVHGRTRNQFYKGQANWQAVAAVKQVVRIPVIVNGDIVDDITAREALLQSGADAVMVGRASEGRPWLPGALAKALEQNTAMEIPFADEQARIMADLHRDIVAHYEAGHQKGPEAGRLLGGRTARKHLAAFMDHLPMQLDEAERIEIRKRLCRMTDPQDVQSLLLEIAERAQTQDLAAVSAA